MNRVKMKLIKNSAKEKKNKNNWNRYENLILYILFTHISMLLFCLQWKTALFNCQNNHTKK